MNSYYFTFSFGQALGSGYVRVEADSLEEARELFKKFFKELAYSGDSLNYSFVYNEE